MYRLETAGPILLFRLFFFSAYSVVRSSSFVCGFVGFPVQILLPGYSTVWKQRWWGALSRTKGRPEERKKERTWGTGKGKRVKADRIYWWGPNLAPALPRLFLLPHSLLAFPIPTNRLYHPRLLLAGATLVWLLLSTG